VVIQPLRDWACAECEGTGNLLIMDEKGPLCLACAHLDHLVFLPAGDAALTRRAKKASGLSAVVVRWSRARMRYERQGVLVEESALEQAASAATSPVTGPARPSTASSPPGGRVRGERRPRLPAGDQAGTPRSRNTPKEANVVHALSTPGIDPGGIT
jgi:hypothetical protein